MPELVPMPKLGFDMAEGTLVRKVKQPGQDVKKGDVLAEIETDKATVEVESPATGVVKGWLVEEGQAVPVGQLMAVIGAPDEQVDLDSLRKATPGEAGAAAAQAPAEQPATPAEPPATPAATATTAAKRDNHGDGAAPAPKATAAPSAPVAASGPAAPSASPAAPTPALRFAGRLPRRAQCRRADLWNRAGWSHYQEGHRGIPTTARDRAGCAGPADAAHTSSGGPDRRRPDRASHPHAPGHRAAHVRVQPEHPTVLHQF